jgi:hypothetical protein
MDADQGSPPAIGTRAHRAPNLRASDDEHRVHTARDSRHATGCGAQKILLRSSPLDSGEEPFGAPRKCLSCSLTPSGTKSIHG